MDPAGNPAPSRPEAVVLCGVQGSGKTTFYRRRFAGTHTRLSLDELKTRAREREALMACLAAWRSFVVDNTNPSPEERAVYVAPAVASGFRVVAFWLEALPREALARNARREGRERIPVPGVLGTYKRLQVPSLDEGFDAVFRVRSEDGHRFRVEPLGTHRARVGPHPA